MGMILCFVVPGILIGLLLGQSVERLKKMARARRKRCAMEERKKLFVYDLRSDFSETTAQRIAA